MYTIRSSERNLSVGNLYQHARVGATGFLKNDHEGAFVTKNGAKPIETSLGLKKPLQNKSMQR